LIALHQILASAAPHDAITNEALVIKELLQQVAPSEVFAWGMDDSLDGQVIPLHLFDAWCSDRGHESILFYHASIGSPDVLRFLLDRNEELILIYHNISPAESFFQYDPAFAGLLIEGRRELEELRKRTTLALADSSFNAAELELIGYDNVKISPLVFDFDGLRREPADPGVLETLASQSGPLLLFVGQILPHKRPDLLLEAFHVLSTYLLPDVRLAMVGARRLKHYAESIDRYLEDLKIEQGWMTGPVPISHLAAYYGSADLFVTLSEHEGFCAPLIEAMAFGLPIVGREYGAIPETLGGAGLVLPPEEGPILIAESLAEVLSRPALQGQMREEESGRLSHFSYENSLTLFLRNIKEVL